MEIIIPKQPEKNAIHPVVIFKQAWGACWGHLGKLSVIYLIFNVPLTVVSLIPQLQSLPGFMWIWMVLAIVIGSWGGIALLLAVNKVLGGQEYTVGQSISQAQLFLGKYILTVLSIGLFVGSIFIAGGICAAFFRTSFLAANVPLSFVCLLAIIALIGVFVFFILRWSVATAVCVLENSGAPASLKQSFTLVKKNINPLLGVYCLKALTYICCLLPMVIVVTISGKHVGSANSQNAAVSLSMTVYIILLSAILNPFWTTMLVILYKKLKEAA